MIKCTHKFIEDLTDCATWLNNNEEKCGNDTKEVVPIQGDCFRCQLEAFDWGRASAGRRERRRERGFGGKGVDPLDKRN